ncbi:MAG TPA: sensor histidine kinase [bacterium]|nr:sensor histidine kinase [bacterium]HQL61000.1 sensor histidine kinase [bacterium]
MNHPADTDSKSFPARIRGNESSRSDNKQGPLLPGLGAFKTLPPGRFGIFRKLLLYFLLVALIPLLVFGIRTIRASEKTILEESRKILLFRTVDTANRVSNSLYACADDLEIVSSVPRNAQSYLEFCRTHRRRIWKRGGTNDNIIEIRERIPLYKEIAFIGPTGKEQILIRDEKIVPDEELRDVSIPANTTYKSEDYFQRTISLPPGEIYVSHLTGWHVTKEEQLGKAEKVEAAVEGKSYHGVIRFAKPIYGMDGGLLGMVMLSIDHRHLMEFTQHIDPLSENSVVFPNYTSGNYAYMFDDEGWIICHPKYWDIRGLYPDGTPVPPYYPGVTSKEMEEIGRTPLNLYVMAQWRDPLYNKIMEDILSQRAGLTVISNFGYDQVKPVLRTRAYAPIHFDLGAYKEHGVFGGVTLGAQIGAVEQIAEGLAQELWIVLVATGFVVILIAVGAARWIAIPVLRMSDAASRIGQGDLDQVVRITSRDELGNLAATFNQMCTGLKESRERLRQTERFASIGEVISGTAHAIKTELNIYGLINNLSILEHLTPPDDPRNKYITAIKEGIDGLEQVIHALLEPTPELALETVDLNEFAVEAVEALRQKAEEKGVRILLERSTTALPVRVQPDLLRQVINNVVVNSLDAMEGREKKDLRIRLVQESLHGIGTARSQGPNPESSRAAVLEISDTGCGIPEQLRQRIFYPFFTTKKDRGGTGLGLYHCSGIIRRHGGEIEIESREDFGTTVKIRLPLESRP